MFITLFTTVNRCSLSWATLILFTSSQSISIPPSVLLSTNIRLDHTKRIFPLGLPSKSHVCRIPRPSQLLCYPHAIGEQYTVHSMQFNSSLVASFYLLPLRLLCAVQPDCACSRRERRVQYSDQPHGVRRRRQGPITVTSVWADVQKILQTRARNITLVPMKAYGGMYVKLHAFLRSILEMSG